MEESSQSMRVDHTYKDNQLHQALTAHQNTNGGTLAAKLNGMVWRESFTNNLASESHADYTDNIGPGNSAVEKPQVGAQPRKSEIERQEQNTDKIFHLLRNFDSKSSLMGTDESNHKPTKDRMHSNNPSEKCRCESHKQCQGNHRLGRSILNTASSVQDREEGWSNGIHQK